jgi:hypothetical protein
MLSVILTCPVIYSFDHVPSSKMLTGYSIESIFASYETQYRCTFVYAAQENFSARLSTSLDKSPPGRTSWAFLINRINKGDIMKDHKKSNLGPAEAIINQMSPEAREVLYQLNGERDRTYLGDHKLYYRTPALRRTIKGGHYRMKPAMAELLMAETVEPAGAHPTEPPTVLATVTETLARLRNYVEASDLDPRGIANGIRQAVGMPVTPKTWSEML